MLAKMRRSRTVIIGAVLSGTIGLMSCAERTPKQVGGASVGSLVKTLSPNPPKSFMEVWAEMPEAAQRLEIEIASRETAETVGDIDSESYHEIASGDSSIRGGLFPNQSAVRTLVALKDVRQGWRNVLAEIDGSQTKEVSSVSGMKCRVDSDNPQTVTADRNPNTAAFNDLTHRKLECSKNRVRFSSWSDADETVPVDSSPADSSANAESSSGMSADDWDVILQDIADRNPQRLRIAQRTVTLNDFVTGILGTNANPENRAWMLNVLSKEGWSPRPPAPLANWITEAKSGDVEISLLYASEDAAQESIRLNSSLTLTGRSFYSREPLSTACPGITARSFRRVAVVVCKGIDFAKAVRWLDTDSPLLIGP